MPPDIARCYCILLRNSHRCLLKTDRAWLDVYINTLSVWQVLGKDEPPPTPLVSTFTHPTEGISHLVVPQPAAADYTESNRIIDRTLQHLIATEYAREKQRPWVQVQTWCDLPGIPEIYLDEASAVSIAGLLRRPRAVSQQSRSLARRHPGRA
jgi:hypothetical protein